VLHIRSTLCHLQAKATSLKPFSLSLSSGTPAKKEKEKEKEKE
jgi:hypothetical protein